MLHKLNCLKKYGAAFLIVLSASTNGDELLGIVGGTNGGTGYAALISSSGNVTPIGGLSSVNTINDVAINTSALGLIGGASGVNGYAAFISSTGASTPIGNIPGGTTTINGVAINNSSLGLIGGSTGSNAYAAFVSGSAATTISNTPTTNAAIASVAINNSGIGLLGGGQGLNAYAAFVFPSGSPTATPITLSTNSSIASVALNDSGQGIIGGAQNTNFAYAAIVSSSGTTATTITNLPAAMTSQILSVAINRSGVGLIGGYQNNLATAFAAFVSSSGVGSPIANMPTNARIQSVAINSSGLGLIGGQVNSTSAYAALISPSGILTPLTLSATPNAQIASVAIDDFGNGVIGGRQNGFGAAYLALVSSSGMVTPITLGANQLTSVAILPLLSQIPTSSLTGNNLIFANYINANAPQLAFYFVPSILDGTLNAALESAAPTRNAFSNYTACNNLFYLTTSLSIHLRGTRSNHFVAPSTASEPVSALRSENRLMVSLEDTPPQEGEDMQSQKAETIQMCEKNQPPYIFWIEAIGALAYQKAQDQTPAFNPTTGGAIAAFDAKPWKDVTFGGGAAYLYTHIHEKQGAGHSNINQEDLFAYASWDNGEWYVDGCLLGGLFQISQVREIQMTGFAFTSRSKPHGGQLLPHVEFGYYYSEPKWCSQSFQWRANPFAMLDWANNWQNDYKETGSGPFNAGQQAHYSSLLRTEIGIRFSEFFLFPNWSLTLQELGGYVNVQSFGAGKVTAFLVGSPGLFTVETLRSAQNLGVGQFLMIFDPMDQWYPTTTVSYQGEFGTKFQSHQANVEFAWNF